MSDGLKNKAFVVTGGGKGLGVAIARELGRHGAKVLIVSRTEQNLATSLEALKAAGVSATAMAADVNDSDAPTAIVDRCVTDHGTIDGVVNCAGTFLWKKFLEIDRAGWQNTIDTNLSSVFWMTQAVGKRLVEQGKGGSIVNVASVHGEVGDGNVVPQCAAKAGVVGLTQATAEALREHGVRVNAVSPGSIEPDSLDKPSDSLRAKVTQADVAKMVAYLASDESYFVTGTILDAFGVTRPVIASK